MNCCWMNVNFLKWVLHVSIQTFNWKQKKHKTIKYVAILLFNHIVRKIIPELSFSYDNGRRVYWTEKSLCRMCPQKSNLTLIHIVSSTKKQVSPIFIFLKKNCVQCCECCDLRNISDAKCCKRCKHKIINHPSITGWLWLLYLTHDKHCKSMLSNVDSCW